MKIENQTTIVTGAGGGIGRAIALRLAAQGAAVTVNDINLENAKRVADEITAAGGKAIAVKADVCQASEVEAMVAETISAFGKVDILVNNAGGSARGKGSAFEDSQEEIWDWIIGVNLKGVYLCSRAVIGLMKKQGYGRIINISSIAATMGHASDYSAAKGGVNSFTRSLARDFGKHGINVNSVSPGAIETEGVMPTPEKKERFVGLTCVGRVGQPEEVAALVNFLVSHEGSFITGQNYVIDGGRTLAAG